MIIKFSGQKKKITETLRGKRKRLGATLGRQGSRETMRAQKTTKGAHSFK